MIRKGEIGRPVVDVGGPVEGAEASAEDVKVKRKNILKVDKYFCNFICHVDYLSYCSPVVKIVQGLIEFIVILCLYYLQVA